MAVRYRLTVTFLCLTLLLSAAVPALGATLRQLELLAGSDFIPEVRAAASRALAKKYVNLELQTDELESVIRKGRTDELRGAAIKALRKKFEDVKKADSLNEARKKAKELEERVIKGTSAGIRKAASNALGLYYLAFNLNDVEGYSMKDLEQMATSSKPQDLREAAAKALESIYPNHYSAKELKEMISQSPHEEIKRGAAGALAVRYASRMPPSPSLAELRKIASDKTKNSWLRHAAGRAYGKLAEGKISPETLEEIVSSGKTRELRQGAALAWGSYLIESDKTKTELLRMACAATSYKTAAYSSAVITALGDRMLNSDSAIRGG
ncbi:hypothetical protein K9M06_03775 [Candidatus Bipolaricaulota bacterium]|nr:hypothetical protein [Candidatus Bipolaricaulota bacterium]